MFKEKFIKLCNRSGESPSSVCRSVGIAPATFSGWTEESIPRRATLMRIADYFGVPVEYFTTDDPQENADEAQAVIAELVALANQLDDDQVQEVIDYAKYLKAKQKK